MGYVQKVFVFIALSALISTALAQISQGGPQTSQGGPHVQQGGPHENQGRAKRQIDETVGDAENTDDILQPIQKAPPSWTTCDITVTPKISCADCNTRMICKPMGGLLKACINPLRPYCNNGICSSVPSDDCISV